MIVALLVFLFVWVIPTLLWIIQETTKLYTFRSRSHDFDDEIYFYFAMASVFGGAWYICIVNRLYIKKNKDEIYAYHRLVDERSRDIVATYDKRIQEIRNHRIATLQRELEEAAAAAEKANSDAANSVGH